MGELEQLGALNLKRFERAHQPRDAMSARQFDGENHPTLQVVENTVTHVTGIDRFCVAGKEGSEPLSRSAQRGKFRHTPGELQIQMVASPRNQLSSGGRDLRDSVSSLGPLAKVPVASRLQRSAATRRRLHSQSSESFNFFEIW